MDAAWSPGWVSYCLRSFSTRATSSSIERSRSVSVPALNLGSSLPRVMVPSS
jgi:hypothetical protein